MTANDFMGKCDSDINGTDYLASQVAKYDELLTNITSSMSNIYVNLIDTMELSNIHRVQQSTEYCKNLHEYVLHEGGCIDKKDVTQEELDMMDHNLHVFNGELHKLAAKWYQTL